MKVSNTGKKDFGMDRNILLSQGLVGRKNYVSIRFSVQAKPVSANLLPKSSGKDRTLLREKIAYIKKSVSRVTPVEFDKISRRNGLPVRRHDPWEKSGFQVVENLYRSFVKNAGAFLWPAFSPGSQFT